MNKLQNTDGSTLIVYSHDKNGNIISTFYPHESGISYDPYFNLTTGLSFEDMETKYWYGAGNERVLKRNLMDPVTSCYDYIYYYRGLNDYPLVEKKYNNSTLQSTKLYIYGPTGLVAIKDGSTFNFILKDHLGSTRAVLNSSNIMVAKYHYSPYGRIMYSYVNTDVAYKFTGQEFDDETGLHNFRARLYDAELGMFYAYDPAAQGFSPFGYANNNPVIYIDKDGKIFGIDDLVFVGILAIGGVINTAMHWDDINKTEGGFWSKLGKGLEFFSVGAISAGAAVIPGGGFIAVGGSSLLNLSGNSLITGDAITLKDVGVTLVTAGLFYGFGNIARGGSFFDDWSPTFSSKTPAEKLAEKTVKSLPDDEWPRGLDDIQRPKYNIIGDSDNLLTKTDPFHNFDLGMQLKTIDEGIWSQTTKMRYNFFELKGAFDLNGKIYNGVYQIGIKSWGEIFHRSFIPWDKFPNSFMLKSNGSYSVPRLLPFNF